MLAHDGVFAIEATRLELLEHPRRLDVGVALQQRGDHRDVRVELGRTRRALGAHRHRAVLGVAPGLVRGEDRTDGVAAHPEPARDGPPRHPRPRQRPAPVQQLLPAHPAPPPAFPRAERDLPVVADPRPGRPPRPLRPPPPVHGLPPPHDPRPRCDPRSIQDEAGPQRRAHDTPYAAGATHSQ